MRLEFRTTIVSGTLFALRPECHMVLSALDSLKYAVGFLGGGRHVTSNIKDFTPDQLSDIDVNGIARIV